MLGLLVWKSFNKQTTSYTAHLFDCFVSFSPSSPPATHKRQQQQTEIPFIPKEWFVGNKWYALILFFLYQELEQRHNAVLQMYGEKAEQAEELRMDLEDVKSMYKSQVNVCWKTQYLGVKSD